LALLPAGLGIALAEGRRGRRAQGRTLVLAWWSAQGTARKGG